MHEKAKTDEANKPAEQEDPTVVVRQLVIKSDKRYGLYNIKREGGGKVPEILKSAYDDYDLCQRHLAMYGKGILKPSPLQVINSKNHPIKPDSVKAA